MSASCDFAPADVLSRVGAVVEHPTVYPHRTGLENLEATRRLIGAAPSSIPTALDLTLETKPHPADGRKKDVCYTS